MQFSVETWAPEYGASIDTPTLEDASEAADLTVERDVGDWAPIQPGAGRVLDEIVFIDGIQRIDARVWIHEGGIATPAVCASLAAGATVCRPSAAVVQATGVVRALFAAAGSRARPIETSHASYKLVHATDPSPEATYFAIHRRRTDLELAVARDDSCDVVVFDGPLHGRNDENGVGFIKSQHKIYVPIELQHVLGDLDDGQRTPVFELGAGQAGTRWSWYLRLPTRRAHPLSGVVRLEIPGSLSAASAIERADLISACLPRFASEHHKEPRAPQNLYPIAGLEQELRRRLGDPHLLERSLRVVAQGA